MEIIKRGTVEEGLSGTWWLGDSDGNCIARLNGDWAETYEGQELGIIVLNERTKPWFEFMAKILNGKDNEYVLAARGLALVSSLIKEEEHEVALSDPLHEQELGEKDG